MTLPRAQRPPQPTLASNLLGWALGALVVVWAGFIAFGYLAGEHEADELTDGHLASVSSLLMPLARTGLAAAVTEGPPPGAPSQLRAHDYQHSMSVLVWDAQGRLLSSTGGAPPVGFESPDGFATLMLGQPPQPWRAFSRWDDAHRVRLMVLLSVRERDDLAADIAGQVIEPGLWMLPVVALVLGLAIHRGLRPLRQLAEEVDALDIQQAQAQVPLTGFEELQATADAINLLAQRYHAALTRERALANEFAHELRTPLAALALHARTARDAPAGPGQQAALMRLEEEALRAGEVLSHLLALARAGRAELDEAAVEVDLDLVARRVVGEFAPAAHAGGRDLGLESQSPLPVQGHAVLLELALRNLVENALAHTPPGTQVAVELDAQARSLLVSDDGAGRAGDAATVADGSVHPLRLGLGLKVVERIAAIHGARFEAEVALPAQRRGWRLSFPARGPQAASDEMPGPGAAGSAGAVHQA